MAFVTLGFGGLGSALGGEGADTIIGLGWAGVFLTFAIIVFAVVSMFAKSKFPSANIALALITTIAGGTFVAIFMVALVGGILALVGVSKGKRQGRLCELKKVSTLSIVSTIVLILFVLLAAGSGGSSDVDRGSDSVQTATDSGQKSSKDNSIKHSIMKEYTANGLKIIIGEVEVRRDRLLVGITVKNESSDTISFYPDQGSIVMGSMKINANMFFTEGSVSGEIRPGVEKSAVIHFLAPESKDLPDEKTITLYLGDVYNFDTYQGTLEFSETITLQ